MTTENEREKNQAYPKQNPAISRHDTSMILMIDISHDTHHDTSMIHVMIHP